MQKHIFEDVAIAHLDLTRRIFPAATALSVLDKLNDESMELRKAIQASKLDTSILGDLTDDIKMEYADCFMCLLDSAMRQGISPGEIVQAIAKKVEINNGREWTQNPNNTYSHVKKELFYIVVHGSYIGNCITFWAKDGHGYTSKIKQAHKFTRDEAAGIVNGNPGKGFTAYLCSHLDEIAEETVDMQRSEFAGLYYEKRQEGRGSNG